MKPDIEQEGLVYCYCRQEFSAQGYQIRNVQFEGGEYLCRDWLTQYHVLNAAIFGITFFIAIDNGLLRIVLRELAVYEGKHTSTQRLAASGRKMWIVMFVNTALVLLLINQKLDDSSRLSEVFTLPEQSPVLQGDYNDFLF